MEKLFKDFIREKRYLHNLTEKTLKFYSEVYHVYDLAGAFENLSKSSLQEAIISFRERGVKPGAINSYIRGINPFLRWLHENGHIQDNLILKLLKCDKPQLRSLTPAELKAIIHFKPKDKTQKRIHTLLLTIMDTGLRINEVLTLERSKVDFDNLLLTVKGKGGKYRTVPFSYELRKVLYKWAKDHKFELIFCNRNGGKLRYDNMRRDFGIIMDKLGIQTDAAFHCFRRTFATEYIKNGGNPFVLQRLLGHNTMTQTNEYVKMVTEDLQKEQHRTSILNRNR